MPARQQRIAVVIGSTRPTRICAAIAAWACEAIGKGSELRYELLDLAEAGPALPRRAAQGRARRLQARAHQGLEPDRPVLRRVPVRAPAVQLGLPGDAEERA
jgi:hypothetical protein